MLLVISTLIGASCGGDVVGLFERPKRTNPFDREGQKVITGVLAGEITEHSRLVRFGGSNPYRVIGDVIVKKDVLLQIDPQVTLQFDKGHKLIVEGILIAEDVRFTSSDLRPNIGDWGGIEFTASSNSQYSKLVSCTVEYATVGVILRSASPSIRENTIAQNGGERVHEGGIYCEACGAEISSNRITGNRNNGIYVYNPSGSNDPVISRNTISNNSGNGIIIVQSNPTVSENVISNNNGDGIFISNLGKPISINRNNIYSNKPYNVFLFETTSDVDAANNWWGTADPSVVDEFIYDKKDNDSLGSVAYQPLMEKEIQP
jgi:parallel beta-helix repeat protein